MEKPIYEEKWKDQRKTRIFPQTLVGVQPNNKTLLTAKKMKNSLILYIYRHPFQSTKSSK
jgi:hypothetical protein